MCVQARQAKNYAEHAQEDSDPANDNSDDDDESFDEDDDPDKIEVPGGGKTLEAAATATATATANATHIRKVNPALATPLIKQEMPALTKMAFPYPTSWPSGSSTSALTASQLVKQEAVSKSSSSVPAAGGSRNHGGSAGLSINVPSPLLDTSLFLRIGDSSNPQQQGVPNSNPLDSITQNLFAKFLSTPAFSSPQFAQVYNALMGEFM